MSDGGGGDGGEEASGDEASNDEPDLAELISRRDSLRREESALRVRLDQLTEQIDRTAREALRYQHFFATSDHPRFISDRMGTIREANAAAGDFLGVAVDFLVGKPLAVFIDRDHLGAFRIAVGEAPQKGVRLPLRLRGRGKEMRSVILDGRALLEGGAIVWCIEVQP